MDAEAVQSPNVQTPSDKQMPGRRHQASKWRYVELGQSGRASKI